MPNLIENPDHVDQDALARKATLKFARKLERWLRAESAGPTVVGRDHFTMNADGVVIPGPVTYVAIELPRQPGQERYFNFRVQVVIREFDGGFV